MKKVKKTLKKSLKTDKQQQQPTTFRQEQIVFSSNNHNILALINDSIVKNAGGDERNHYEINDKYDAFSYCETPSSDDIFRPISFIVIDPNFTTTDGENESLLITRLVGEVVTDRLEIAKLIGLHKLFLLYKPSFGDNIQCENTINNLITSVNNGDNNTNNKNNIINKDKSCIYYNTTNSSIKWHVTLILILKTLVENDITQYIMKIYLGSLHDHGKFLSNLLEMKCDSINALSEVQPQQKCQKSSSSSLSSSKNNNVDKTLLSMTVYEKLKSLPVDSMVNSNIVDVV